MANVNVNRRGEAAIIGTVLLVLAVMVSGGIVSYYVLHQVRSADASCLEALNSVQFSDVGYTCTMTDPSGTPLTVFSVRISDDRVEGFQLGLDAGGTAQTYAIQNSAHDPNICLIDSRFDEPLVVPEPGNTRTYVARGTLTKIFISPILKGGKNCYAEARRDTTITATCVDPEVKNRVTACLGQQNSSCGNSVVDNGETCDPPQTPCTPAYGSSCGYCDVTCHAQTVSGGQCGDGILQTVGGETCDDRNAIDGDGCDHLCHLEPCTLTALRWERVNAHEGDIVKLLLNASSCAGKTVSFNVSEDDLLGSDAPAIKQPNPVIVPGDASPLQVSWTSEWTNDDLTDCFLGNCNPPEYYFSARVVGGSNFTSSTASVDELKITACGDASVQVPEQCDGSVGGTTCVNVPGGSFTGGVLQCYARGVPAACTFDVRNCTGSSAVCGNGLIEGSEVCDDRNGASGDGCSSSCQIENGWLCTGQPSVCTRCGNNIIDQGEECDRNNFGTLTCEDFGRSGGNLACTPSCEVDTSQCSMCGNTQVESGELCELGNVCQINGVDSGICSSDCHMCDPANLSRGTWQGPSAIEGQPMNMILDGSRMGGLTLEFNVYEDDGIFGSTLITPAPLSVSVPNGATKVITSWATKWECDGDIAGFCFWGEPEYYFTVNVKDTAITLMSSAPELTTHEASPTCGNGIIQPGESCEVGVNGMQASCTPAYGSSCTYCAACNIQTNQGGFCGDGSPNGPEACDSSQQLCITGQGYLGTQTCNAQCTAFGSCSSTLSCGDGVRNGPEACDNNDLNGATCQSFGFSSGSLYCSSCSFDTSSCVNAPTCGNGVVESGEACDPPGSTQGCTLSGGGATGNVIRNGQGQTGNPDSGAPASNGQQTCSGQCQWGTCGVVTP